MPRLRVYRAKPVSNIKHKSYKVRGENRRIQKHSYPENWDELSAEVKARDNYCCVICQSTKSLEVHHILALSRGGTNSKRNLITLCNKCHKKRHKHL
jgi:5-methylcytosine-specific restriction protein A